jgi:hypothetical protein
MAILDLIDLVYGRVQWYALVNTVANYINCGHMIHFVTVVSYTRSVLHGVVTE